MDTIDRNNRNKKIVKLKENEPLLKSLELERMISMILPAEIEKAQAILKEFLEGFKHLDTEKKIVLAYLIGEMQGFDNFYSMGAGQSIQSKIHNIYQSGFSWGYSLATIHYPKKEKNDVSSAPSPQVDKK